MSNLGFLTLADAEVVNSARTGAYVRNGLGPGGLVVGDCLCSVLDREVPGSFVSPIADPAPWYDATRAESGEFLGFLIDSISGLEESPFTRGVTQLQSGGGSLGRLTTTAREVTFHGWIVATTDCGVDYGWEWLLARLQGCDDCGVVQARIRTCCPPEDGSDDERGNYRMNGVGVTHAALTGETLGPGCPVAEFEFTIVAEHAELVGAVLPCLTESILNPDLEPDTVNQSFNASADYTANYTTDTGAAPTVVGPYLNPGSTVTAQYRRNNKIVRNVRNTWKIRTGASVAAFSVDVFLRGDTGGAQTYLAAQFDNVGFRLVKLVAGAQTILATSGGASGGAIANVTYDVSVGIHDRRLWCEWKVLGGFASCVVELSEADAVAFDTATRRHTGLRSLVDTATEQYGPNLIDTAMDFDTWWAGIKPLALCCTIAATTTGSVAGLVTLEAGLEQDMHAAVVHAYAPTALKTSATLQTTTTLETRAGTRRGSASIRDLPAGSTLLVDGTLRRNVWTSGSENVEGSGFVGLPTSDSPSTWPVVGSCGDAGEVCAYSDGYGGSGDDATVTIQTQAATL